MAKVLMVEIVEEDEKGQRTVKRLNGDDAKKFAKAVEFIGIIVKWEEMF